ncbi:MAG: DUF3160 domain-containing protein [Armatimonadetes bacterium]|nr:DUF3160 domain-containing protein [Armatimonadota bacterium]
MANALMAGRGDITTAQHGYRLMEMAEIITAPNRPARPSGRISSMVIIVPQQGNSQYVPRGHYEKSECGLGQKRAEYLPGEGWGFFQISGEPGG